MPGRGRREHEEDEGEGGSQRIKRKFGEGMVTIFLVLMAPWVYAYVKTHQIVHSKYVQCMSIKLFFKEAVQSPQGIHGAVDDFQSQAGLIFMGARVIVPIGQEEPCEEPGTQRV